MGASNALVNRPENTQSRCPVVIPPGSLAWPAAVGMLPSNLVAEVHFAGVSGRPWCAGTGPAPRGRWVAGRPCQASNFKAELDRRLGLGQCRRKAGCQDRHADALGQELATSRRAGRCGILEISHGVSSSGITSCRKRGRRTHWPDQTAAGARAPPSRRAWRLAPRLPWPPGQGVGPTLAIVNGGKFPWRDADVSARDMRRRGSASAPGAGQGAARRPGTEARTAPGPLSVGRPPRRRGSIVRTRLAELAAHATAADCGPLDHLPATCHLEGRVRGCSAGIRGGGLFTMVPMPIQTIGPAVPGLRARL